MNTIGNGSLAGYFYDVARGVYPGKTAVSAYGRRVTTVGPESGYLWPDGAYSIPPVGGVQMRFVSTDVEDSLTGAGVRKLHLHYLNANKIDADITVEMNGITPVLTVPTDILFIQGVFVEEVGSALSAVGDIKITSVNGLINYGFLGAGKVRSSTSTRMVPADKDLYIIAAVGGSASGPAAAKTEINLFSSQLEDHSSVYPLIAFPHATLVFQDNSFGIGFEMPLKIESGNIAGFTYLCDKSAATVSATWWGIFEDRI